MKPYTQACIIVALTLYFVGCRPSDSPLLKGTYTTTISHANLPGSPEMVGTWEINFDGAGKYTLRHDKLLIIQGVYSLSNDTLRVEKEAGMGACTTTTPGIYKVSHIDKGMKLELVADECPGRTLVLAMLPLTAKAES